LTDSAAKAGLGVSGVLVHALGGSFIFGLNYGYGIFGARAFGAKNVSKYKQYFVQGLTNLTALVILFMFVCFLSYRLSILTGQD
jgi:Na+-driven multidrug efflux pump